MEQPKKIAIRRPNSPTKATEINATPTVVVPFSATAVGTGDSEVDEFALSPKSTATKINISSTPKANPTKITAEQMKATLAKKAAEKEAAKNNPNVGTIVFAQDIIVVTAFNAHTDNYVDEFIMNQCNVDEMINNLYSMAMFFKEHENLCYFDVDFADDVEPEEVEDPNETSFDPASIVGER